MKPESEESLKLKVEVITVCVGLGVALLALGGLAWTRAQFRPLAFISLTVVGFVIAAYGIWELRRQRRGAS